MPPQNIISDQASRKSSLGSVIALVVIFLLLVGASVYMYKSGAFDTKDGDTKTPAEQPFTEEKVVVTGADLSAGVPLRNKIPAAFAKDIPVPADAVVVESLTTDYPEKMMMMSTFVYTTKQSAKAIYALYEPYLAKNGFVAAAEGKKDSEYVTGVKDGDDLGVIIGSNGTDTVVNVVFLDRR